MRVPVVGVAGAEGAQGWLTPPAAGGAVMFVAAGGVGRRATSTGDVVGALMYVDVLPGRYWPGAVASFTVEAAADVVDVDAIAPGVAGIVACAVLVDSVGSVGFEYRSAATASGSVSGVDPGIAGGAAEERGEP